MTPASSSSLHLARRLGAGMALVLGLGGVAVASGPRADEVPSKPAAETGADLYTKSCTKCHGDDGKGDTGMGKKAKEKGEKWPDLSQSHDARDEVILVINDGVKDTKMKGYSDKLTAAQIELVADYVLSLRK